MARRAQLDTLPIDAVYGQVHESLGEILAALSRGERAGSLRRVAFVGSEHGAGATTLATCTALALARDLGEPTLLFEGNWTTPAMAGYLGLPPAPGLTTVLEGEATLEEAVRDTRVAGLRVLTAGGRRDDAWEADRGEVRRLMQEAFGQGSSVIADIPPLLSHPEALRMLEDVDTTVLVLRAGSTSKAQAAAATRMLEGAGLPVLGTMLNRFRADRFFA
ncbi:MAG: CpsD/CapB family tyrosine-protein kinase [Planctomycetota bacterium]|jgi:Mrp family chromosome partitioning ATPase|nr:CpsD/CapB family tyrosine-protein kinase [Planctomycetota bacterium]MDP6761671.1 CpsD/CapB family tyrosine-protein kinase [Planctomycetota bacterium]MDP6990700.1 CpsD/CapB family tyrosine-protein kinase [Planctomycetota bacterium]